MSINILFASSSKFLVGKTTAAPALVVGESEWDDDEFDVDEEAAMGKADGGAEGEEEEEATMLEATETTTSLLPLATAFCRFDGGGEAERGVAKTSSRMSVSRSRLITGGTEDPAPNELSPETNEPGTLEAS